MEKLIYSEETKTLRIMPENYMVASFEKHYWVVDPDAAIPADLAVEIFKFFSVHENKFKLDSWKKLNIAWLVDKNVIQVDLEELKDRMEGKFGYEHSTDEEDCWTNTVMDALQDLTGLEENLREMFKKKLKPTP